MSQKTEAEEKMVETFEKLSAKFGVEPEAYLEALMNEYVEEGEKEETPEEIVSDLMEEEETDGEDTQEGHLKANGEKCGICEDIEDCHVHSKGDEGQPETSESEGWNQPAFDDPNPKGFYDYPKAIMAEEKIRNHKGFKDLQIGVVKLQHKQGKHGVCEGCQIAYAGKGAKCAKCENTNQTTSNGDDDSLTVADIQQAFGVNAETARTAKENYEKGLYGSVKEAIEA